MVKIIIVILLLAILVSLFHALIVMVTNRPTHFSKLIARRLIFSIATLIIILGALKFDSLKLQISPLKLHKQTQTNTAIPHPQNASTKPQPETQSVFLS